MNDVHHFDEGMLSATETLTIPVSASRLDVSPLEKVTLGGLARAFLIVGLLRSRAVLTVLRCCLPVFRLPFVRPRTWFVTRFVDVQEILNRDRIFNVREERVLRLNQGCPFLLGQQDGPEFRRMQAIVMQVFRREDRPRIEAIAAACARRVLAAQPDRLDGIAGLITDACIDICEQYYGVAVHDRDDFTNITMAISTWLFYPWNTSPHDALGEEASRRLNQLVEHAIDFARPEAPPAHETVLGRLLRLRAARPELQLSREEIRTILVGMILGFVPTNTMAGGHMLEMLLRRADFMQVARDAALGRNTANPDQLRRVLFEAMRFMPLLRDPWRTCRTDTILAAGRRGESKIAAGDLVAPLVMSAMFDRRKVEDPKRFWPGRPEHHFMLFGHGLHRCIGAMVAEAHLTPVFRVLLQHGVPRRARKRGRMKRLSAFPRHLFIEFKR